MDKKTARMAFLTYQLLSLVVAAIFVILASGNETLTRVALVGGAVWVYLLALIVTMPIIIPWAKKKYMGVEPDHESMGHH